MHFVIMGCGRVGSTLAHGLEAKGRTVAIIDQNGDAGIEEAYAFAAVSSGDNSNILAARVARETFGVSNVVARIYDTARAEVYQRLGIPTVATVTWTADQMLRRLLPHGAEPEWRDPTGTVRLAETHVATAWVGSRVSRIEEAAGAQVAFLTRLGEGMLPDRDTVIQDGDLVHVVMREDQAERVEAVFARGPQEG